MKANSPLKKHHFWILFGVAPLLTLIGVFVVSSTVGGQIAKKEADIDATKKAILAKQKPKTDALLKDAGKVVEKVSSKQGELHKVNWDRQKALYTWPVGSKLLRRFNDMDLKFGDNLPTESGEFEEFKKTEVYIHEFSSINPKTGAGAPGTGMADKIAPTQFRGGWQNVLRHVTSFGDSQLTRDQVWLMMEDIWVQRSMLDAIRSINAELATFRRAKDVKGEVGYDESFDERGNKLATDPLGKPIVERTPDGGTRYKTAATPEDEKRKALFRNRLWAVELELVQDGGSKRLTGTLTNLSERLQLMGVGNIMTLNVWFSKTQAQPFVFKIGGEFLPGKGATKRDGAGRDVPANVLQVVPIDDHLIPPAMAADEIVRVEQVFDIRTVPVKRVEALALGFADARSAGKPLIGPAAPFKQDAPTDPAAGGMATGDGAGGRFGGMGGPADSGFGMGGTAGATGGGATGTGTRWGGGPITSVIDGNRKRYLADGVTSQVRRMPVGIVVVVDQAYMQDMLLAFANSPLRFQTTQVCWTRFRGTLAGIGGAGAAGGDSGITIGGSGSIGFSGSADPDGPRPGMLRPPSGPPASGPGPMGFGPMGFGPMGSGPTGPGSGYPGSGNPSSVVSESQITSALVELGIYGTVSLYEKFDPTKPADGTAAPAPAPAPMGMGTAPAPMGMGTDMGMTPAPKADPKTDPKSDPKSDPVPAPKTDPKVDPKADPKMRRRRK